MTTAKKYSTDVIIIGAGPVGLTIANGLGQSGVKVTVVEQLDQLIDYPRAIGIDDESLRTLQSVGLIDKVLPHTTPDHAMRFLTPSGRCFADIQPKTREFGWPRRNAFVQPFVDAVLLEGLERFKNVDVRFSRSVQTFKQFPDHVEVQVQNKDGEIEVITGKYLVACDGGNSYVRRMLNIPFEGETAPNQWIVVDIANDPLATPHIYLCCDPVRPYVSAALPHGIRRFEFMVMPGETQEELSQPENMAKLLSKVLPNTENIDVIRNRVYTHNARIASRFRDGRVLLAGDAAHIMPVWQGQGYNSGLRDAFNLSWKLAMVVQGKVSDKVLDTYQVERHDHAKAMIDLSVTAGNVLAPPKKWQGTARDAISYVLNYIKPAKQYLLEMRFKPMPQYKAGVLVGKVSKTSPIGKMFIQPKMQDRSGKVQLLDEFIGTGFAVIAWGVNPTWGLKPETLAKWKALGVKFIKVIPPEQMSTTPQENDDVLTLGDSEHAIRAWFGKTNDSMVFLRPDKFVAAIAIPQISEQTSQAIFEKLGV